LLEVFNYFAFRNNHPQEAIRMQVLNDLQDNEYNIDVRQLVVFRADHCQKAGYSIKTEVPHRDRG
jgi:hypothetical protein